MMQLTLNRIAKIRALPLGVLLAALMATFMLAAKPALASTTFTVINTNDSGAGSLRQAIVDANATTGADTIEFNIPGTVVKTIAPTTELPKITGPVTINGYSQPGAQPNQKAIGSDAVLKVVLSGASSPGADGLEIGASNSTIKGLVINRWSQGIRIDGPDATGNKIAGNFIGTDASGTKDLGNSYAGVNVYDASNNTIGGTTAGERNIISGNDGSGVLFYGSNARGNKVTGNFMGTDKFGAAVLGNSANGVFISDSSDNTVGGTTAGARNVIADNDGSGVSIYGSTATGNRVLSNSIFANYGLGIDLGDDGPTPNDPDDADTGANNLQNFPTLSSARKNSSGTTTVRGKLNSTPDSTFRVQFFLNPKGTNEGKTLLGSQLVSTDASGEATFAFATKKPVRLEQNVTATATGPGGNTSEFSAPRQVVAS
jgi:hypothetical protein